MNLPDKNSPNGSRRADLYKDTMFGPKGEVTMIEVHFIYLVRTSYTFLDDFYNIIAIHFDTY